MDKKHEFSRPVERERKSYAELLIADYGDIEPPRKVGVSRFARNISDCIAVIKELEKINPEDLNHG
jgi:hypothetical protein